MHVWRRACAGELPEAPEGDGLALGEGVGDARRPDGIGVCDRALRSSTSEDEPTVHQPRRLGPHAHLSAGSGSTVRRSASASPISTASAATKPALRFTPGRSIRVRITAGSTEKQGLEVGHDR